MQKPNDHKEKLESKNSILIRNAYFFRQQAKRRLNKAPRFKCVKLWAAHCSTSKLYNSAIVPDM